MGMVTWFESLSMEKVFAITWTGTLLAGAVIGFLVEWIFRKENERNDEDG